jgi:hypothetical protein
MAQAKPEAPCPCHREEEGEAVRRGDPGLKNKIAASLPLLAMTCLAGFSFVQK